MARPSPDLTKFVLSLPMDLSAKEVVIRARAAGIKAKKKKVARIRREWSVQPAKPVTTMPVAPAKLVPAAPSGPRPVVLSKSDFIRRLPVTMSVAEVVAKGKAAGLTFSDTLVYMVRGRSTAKKPVSRRVPATPKTTVAARVRPSVGPRPVDVLRAVATEIGLGRALAILQRHGGVLRG